MKTIEVIDKEVMFTMRVPAELRKEMKKRALIYNITLKEWVMRAILEQIKAEDQYR